MRSWRRSQSYVSYTTEKKYVWCFWCVQWNSRQGFSWKWFFHWKIIYLLMMTIPSVWIPGFQSIVHVSIFDWLIDFIPISIFFKSLLFVKNDNPDITEICERALQEFSILTLPFYTKDIFLFFAHSFTNLHTCTNTYSHTSTLT